MPTVIETARWAAAQRARESARADRLFADPLASLLAGEEGATALSLSERYNPRHEDTANYISIRIRFFDEVAQQAAADGVRQIVLLAAGMDARAFRLPWPEGTAIYELDHPELLAAKEEILQKNKWAPNCRRVTLGTNLENGWAPHLTAAGFDPNQRSAWLIEGLFYYLEESVVHHVLSQTAKLAAPGSVLATDLVSHSFMTAPWFQPFLKAMEERGFGWRFGTDDPVGLFSGHGWRAEVRQPNEEGTRFNPRRFPALPPGQPSVSWGFFALARRT